MTNRPQNRAIFLSTFWAAILVFSFLPSPAWAAGPRIAQVTMDGRKVSFGVSGAVLLLQGNGFGLDKDSVTAKAGGQDCLVLEAKTDTVRIMLPSGLRPGLLKIRVAVGGAQSNAVRFEIVSVEDYKKRGGLRKERELEGGEVEETGLLILTSAREDQERGKPKITVAGRGVNLPNYSRIQLALIYSGKEIDKVTTAIQQGTFECQFGPYEKALPAGSYLVRATFDMTRQPRGVRKALRKLKKDPALKKKLHSDSTGAALEIGGRDDIKSQWDEERRKYKQLADKTKKMLTTLEEHYRAALQAAFDDEDAWEKHVKAYYTKTLDQRQRKRKIEELSELAKQFVSDGKLNQKAWREWLDANFRSSLVDIHREHKAYTDRWVAVRFPRIERKVAQIPGLLLGISASRSLDLYKRCKLQPSAEDLRPKGSDLMSIPVTRTRQYLLKIFRDIKKSLK